MSPGDGGKGTTSVPRGHPFSSVPRGQKLITVRSLLPKRYSLGSWFLGLSAQFFPLILTYQLFLFIMNNPMYNRDQKGCPIFSVHDVLFCDECHNIPEIVQLQYSPTILYEDFDKLKSLYYRTTSYQPSLFDVSDNQGGLWDGTCIYSKYKTWEELEKVLHELWDRWTCVESRKDEDIASAQLYLDILIRYISLSDNIIYSIYRESLYNNAKIRAAQVRKILLVKYIMFYALGFASLLIFGYYLATFGAVYQNTQIILVKNFLISYAFSLMFPFIIIALPSVFRRFALKDSTRQWMFDLSRILQYI